MARFRSDNLLHLRYVLGRVLIFWYLLPYSTVLRETQSALCGGEQDFVFAVGATGLPMWLVFRGDWAPVNGSGQ